MLEFFSESQQEGCDKEKPDVAEVVANSTTMRHTENAAANTFSQPIHDVFVQYNRMLLFFFLKL